MGLPPPPPDQLAEPVGERLRILRFPRSRYRSSALGGITIEAPERVEDERRPGIGSASTGAHRSRVAHSGRHGRRNDHCRCRQFVRLHLLEGDGDSPAAAADFVGICRRCSVIVLGRLRISADRLRGQHAGIARGRTRTHQRFDGSATSRSLRRWRVLGTCLSAVSLGMGYAWVFLDEDALCWHDRITHTYLAPQTPSKPWAAEELRGSIADD